VIRRWWQFLLAAPLVGIGLTLGAGQAMAISITPPSGVSPNGNAIYNLYLIISIPAIVVFVLVEALLLICVIRFRRSTQPPGYVPPQFHGNRPLEITWTVVPFLILVFIGVLSFRVLQQDFVRPSNAATGLALVVYAHQYGWEYDYPQGFSVQTEGLNAVQNPLVVPTGTLVRLQITSKDVIHSWWVPDITGKTDAVPGYYNYTWFKISKPGVWRGECAELCGSGHYSMQIRVEAVSPAQFRKWVAEQEAKAKTANVSPASRPVESRSVAATTATSF
jgi:cytochrome c oxidase subunit 2